MKASENAQRYGRISRAYLLASRSPLGPIAHASHIRRALHLAQRGAGFASPNPLVGCVIVGENGETIGEGWHARYGEAHAEVAALADAEARLGEHAAEALRRATLYVTLEPCSHTGKTPPCADLLVRKSIPRVVVGMQDPFPRVEGRGIARLREAGVAVTVGVEEAACREMNAAFLHHVAWGRPRVTLKIAQTLDGRIAARTGDSRWVSGPASRALVHAWRGESDGVLVGSGTALADDPALTVRTLPEDAPPHAPRRQPTRLVLDRAGALPAHLRLFTDDFASRTVAITAESAAPAYADALESAGGRLLRVPLAGDHLDLRALLDALGESGQHGERRAEHGGADVTGRAMQSLLVEAGPGLATALLRQGLVDELALFIAPKVLGAGIEAVGDLGALRMADALRVGGMRVERMGEDVLARGSVGRPS